MKCTNCGTINTRDSKFCRECGTALHAPAATMPTSPGRAGPAPLSFDEKVKRVQQELTGLDCGRCGYASCAENAAAIVRGESPYDSCVQASPEARERIRLILGLPESVTVSQHIWRTLTSVKLAIGLIAALTLLSILGTIIPQGQPDMNYISRYGLTGYKLIKFFTVDKLFHSWYFLGLLALLGLNTLACLIKRFQVSWQLLRRPHEGRSPVQLLRLENSLELPTGAAASASLERVAEILTGRGYRIRRKGLQLAAQKHLIGRLGVDLFHASLLLLLLGAIVGGLFGFEGFQVAHKGEIFDVPGADFQVRVDDLWTVNYPDSSRIKDWYTRLTILEGGQEVKTQTIEVNHPLTHKGISFYQSSFGSDWLGEAQLTFSVKQGTDGTALSEYEVTVGETFPLQTDLVAKFVAFYPHFVLTEQGPRNRSQRLENPAAYLEIYQGDTLKYWGWTFAHFPDMQIFVAAEPKPSPSDDSAPGPGHGGQGELPYRIEITGMHAPEFTGLQFSYNPGIWLVYTSFILMTLGMFLNFYLPPRWIWAVAERGRLCLGGKGRDDHEFMAEFEIVAEEVRRALPAASAEKGELRCSIARSSST